MTALTPSQWKAVEAVDRHVLVAAGAGTGKTHTVVHRILYLLGAEIDGRRHPAPLALRDIAAITFTNAAAQDLRRKLREALHRAGRRAEAWEVDTARVGTIHSFCADLLREFALRSGRGLPGRILDEAEATESLAGASREAVLAAVDARADGVEELLGDWSVRDVENFVRLLASDADRLEGYRRQATVPGPHERTLLSLADDARQRHLARLEGRGESDFDALIVATRDMLRDSPDVRGAVRRRLRLLVVDEFQDTDPAQREIAYLLGDPQSGSAESTRLFLVGDPKQSIFRFRRADVTVWRAVERDFTERGLGLVVPLTENFRSVPAILGFVDAVVGPLLDRPVDGQALSDFEVPFVALEAHQEPASDRRPDGSRPRPADLAVELIAVEPDEEGKRPNAVAFRASEARAVARRLAELHRGGVPQREMAVLLASWKDLDIYETALRAAGLRTYAARGEGFLSRREVMDLVLALETIREPADDRALFGFLRSPWICLSDESLLRIALAGGSGHWERLAQVQLPEPGEQERLTGAIGIVGELLELRDRIPLAELLETLLLRTGFLAHLALKGDAGAQAIANVRKFVGLARSHRHLGVGEFLRMLSELEAARIRLGDARLHDAKEEVVTITTIHSAKGLEWEVVAWCDLGRQPPDKPGNLLRGRDRIVLKQPDLENDSQPEPWPRVATEFSHEAAAERKRLWYVASTRAKDWLLLAGFHRADRANDTSPAAALAQELPPLEWQDGEQFTYSSRGGRTFHASIASAGVPLPAEGEATIPPTVELAPGTEPVVVPAGDIRHSATSLMEFRRCARRHWFKYVQGLREPPRPGTEGEWTDAIVRGQIVHDVLEHLREEAELDGLLEDAIQRLDDDAPALETPRGLEYRARLHAEVERVRDTDPYRELSRVPGARRELRFAHLAGAGWHTEGAMDLAAPGHGGIRIVDVKTSPVGPERARQVADAYSLQRDVYLNAAEAIGGSAVASFAFQFSAAGMAVVQPVSRELREQSAAEVRRVREAIASGAAEPNARPAECRFCGYMNAGWCEGSRQPPEG